MDPQRHHDCPACGAPLPADLRDEFCAVCVLRGALDLSGGSGPPVHLLGRVGDFELMQEIARGGMGVVYRARQAGLDRECAVKLLIAGPFADATARQRFRSEATSAARLRHPHIVEVFQVGEHEGQPFLAMEYVPGGSLHDLIRDGPLTSRAAAQLMVKVARAVHFAHDQGVLHRDLKPSNLLIDAFGEPRITDFGLAKQLGEDSELTLSGQVLGSPGFMAPEQAAGGPQSSGPAADIYSLGAILYHLTTSRPPFQGASAAAILRQVEREEPVRPRRLNPGIDRDLERILLRCLEKSPTRRYPSARHLADDLQRYLDGHPVEARPVSAPERLWRWSRRRPAAAALFGLLIVIALGSSVAAWRIGRAEVAARQHLTLARLNAYAGTLSLADRALEEGDLARTRELLESQIPAAGQPDLRTFEWHLLWRASQDQARTVLTGHQHAVTALAFLHDGRRLASGSWDRSVGIWSLDTGQLERRLTNEPGRIWSVDVSPEGGLLLAAGDAGLSLWQTADWFHRGRLPGDFSYGAARFLPGEDQVAIGTRAGVSIWSLRTGTVVTQLAGATGPIALSPDGQQLATRGGKSVFLFRIADWSLARQFRAASLTSFGLRDLAFAPDGHGLFLGDSRGWLGRIDLQGSETNLTFLDASRTHPRPHEGWVSDIVVSPDGRHLATTGADQSVLLWRAPVARLRHRWLGHRHEVWAAAFSRDSRWLATAGKDETIRLWNLQQPHTNLATSARPGTVLGPWSDHEVLAEARNARGQRLLRVHDWRLDRAVRDMGVPGLDQAADLFFQPATREIAFRLPPREVQVWSLASDPPSRRLTVPVQEHSNVPLHLSADGTRLAAYRASDHGTTLRRLPDGAVELEIADSGGLLAMDADYLVTVPTWETPRVWDARTGRRLADLVGHKERVARILLLPGRHTVVTAGWDGTLRFWALPSGRLLTTTRSQRQGLYALALSPDRQTLAAAGQDGITCFWNVATRQQTSRWVERQLVEDLWFTPSGRALLQTTGDRLVAVEAERDPGASRAAATPAPPATLGF